MKWISRGSPKAEIQVQVLTGVRKGKQMAQNKYRPKTMNDAIAWLSEECGETVAAIGKVGRWGLSGSNPELPEEERELNGDAVLREIQDVKKSLALAEKFLLENREHWAGYKPLPAKIVEDMLKCKVTIEGE